MKRNTKFALALVSATALGAALALPVYAHGGQQDGWGGQAAHQGGTMGGDMGANGMGAGMKGGMGGANGGMDMMQNMMRMHGQMNGQAGAMGGMGAMGNMGGMGGNLSLFGNLDTNGDGQVTPQEAKDAQLKALKKYDTNEDGTLSLTEFEALHSAAIREKMVDRFQGFDNDGDGKVTADEITAKAQQMEKLGAMRKARGAAGDADHDKPARAPSVTQGGMMNDGATKAAPKN